MNEVKKRSNVSCVNVLILTILRLLFCRGFANPKPLDEDVFAVDKTSKNHAELRVLTEASLKHPNEKPDALGAPGLE